MDANTGAISRGLGITPNGALLSSALADESYDIGQVIHTTDIPNVDVLPADDRMLEVELGLSGRFGRELRLRAALREHPQSRYAFILIDCGPSVGFLLGNSLVAAHEVIIPVDLGTDSLNAMAEVTKHINFTRKEINYGLRILGILINNKQRRTLYAEQAEGWLRREYGTLIFETVIPHSIIVAESRQAGQPIVRYSPRSELATLYQQLADEVLARSES